MNCIKCPYFVKEKDNKYRAGIVIVGFCRLRQKHISDETIHKEFCKDRAVFSL